MRFGAADLLPLRGDDPTEKPDWSLRTSAEWTLLQEWNDRETFATRLREVFDAIPQKALAANPAASEMEAFKHALKISLSLVVFAAMGGRRDLHHIIKSLHT